MNNLNLIWTKYQINTTEGHSTECLTSNQSVKVMKREGETKELLQIGGD